MKLDIKIKANLREVEIEAWAKDGKWFAALPDARLMVSGASLNEALCALEVAVDAHFGHLITQTMKLVWDKPFPLTRSIQVD